MYPLCIFEVVIHWTKALTGHRCASDSCIIQRKNGLTSGWHMLQNTEKYDTGEFTHLHTEHSFDAGGSRICRWVLQSRCLETECWGPRRSAAGTKKLEDMHIGELVWCGPPPSHRGLEHLHAVHRIVSPTYPGGGCSYIMHVIIRGWRL